VYDAPRVRACGWRDRIAPSLAAAKRVVLIAQLGDAIAGTAQLDLDTLPNQRHRGEGSKLPVDPRGLPLQDGENTLC
jgi:hypothetical protein